MFFSCATIKQKFSTFNMKSRTFCFIRINDVIHTYHLTHSYV